MSREQTVRMFRTKIGEPAAAEREVGGWLTPIEPTSAAAAREGLALPSDNAAMYVSRVTVPAGTRIQESLPSERSISLAAGASATATKDSGREFWEGGAARPMNEPAPIFTVERGQLTISDATTGEIRWQEKLLDTAVSDVKTIPGTDRAVVLLDYMAHGLGPFQNLVCVGPAGQVVWRATLPSGSNTDAYVSFDLGAGLVTANSWNGYYVELDAASGRILDTTFTK